jgi:hypothetical protein
MVTARCTRATVKRGLLFAELLQRPPGVVEDEAGPVRGFQRCPAPHPAAAGLVLADHGT